MGVGAPVLAYLVSKNDGRRLLVGSLAWYAVGHGLCALMSDYTALIPRSGADGAGRSRVHAAGSSHGGPSARPEHRGRNITFVFMGWSIASVVGMPLAAWVSERLGWRTAMGMVACGSALAAFWLMWVLPRGIHACTQLAGMAARVSLAFDDGGGAGYRVPKRGATNGVLAYAAPYFKFGYGASPEQISLMFAWFGSLALTGNLLLNRFIDRIGAARAVTITCRSCCSAWPF